MAKIEIPKRLRELMEDSEFDAPIKALADRVGEILADNKLPFFPDYTDHGTDHVSRVLYCEVDLVPKSVWDKSGKDSDPRLLCDADGAVIIGATLLHDIAMHLRPEGFLELVAKDSRFKPLPWFKESHEGHTADRSWHELWEEFLREARRFSDHDLANIIGEGPARLWKFHDLPEKTGEWQLNQLLIVGEFIRRHHARLAHEVAIYGFPGLPIGSGEGQFPAMGQEPGHPLMRLADLIGLTARSHGTSLRVCKSYLDASPLYPGTPKPMGTAVLYPMALLRVADFLQIDRQRAPAALLRLRTPQSPISVQEWKKHRAVQAIGPATDPRGKMVTVSTDVSLPIYLQLRELLHRLQEEMDHSTAVLDESYGNLSELGLNQLNLAIRRVYTNLHSPAFRDSLPYVPEPTGFSTDPNLLTLLVEPLYGKEPGVGVRELLQNAVDAVRELEAWCGKRGIKRSSLALLEQDADVLIDFIKQENDSWLLRVRDKGIGMTAETIHGFFLRAGASFRRSPEWANEFLDEKGHPRVSRAGRFGIGVFAVFLLGSTFRVRTRHASDRRSFGYEIEASATAQLVEIRRVEGIPVGTTVEVGLSSETVNIFCLDDESRAGWRGPLERQIDWYCWDWPPVVKRVIGRPSPSTLDQALAVPIRDLPPDWSVIHPQGFDAVYWTFSQVPSLICNGLRISRPGPFSDANFDWPEETGLRAPNLAVVDSQSNLALTIQRYQLSNRSLTFTEELIRDVSLSFIAHALVCGPTSASEIFLSETNYPLISQVISRLDRPDNCFSAALCWCATSEAFIPADPWLYAFLDVKSFLVYGILVSCPRNK